MRVLVVEDDAALGPILVRGLTEDGFVVDLVTRVDDAMFHADEHRYDVIVLDLGLPDGDGLELCRAWRAAGRPTPVLMLTARDGLSDTVGGLDAGADDYLTKPFHFPELSARVRALGRRSPEQRPLILEHGDLRLDPATRRVWRGAILVPLTAREFTLLERLLARPSHVHSRSDLLDHVWDANYDGLSNVVDVHIANLRRKLAQPEMPDLIETVRGSGYRLADATVSAGGASS